MSFAAQAFRRHRKGQGLRGRRDDLVDIIKVVLSGIPQRGGNLRMPSFETELNNQQIADILNYVRTSWGNIAMPDVTTSMVTNLRQTSSNGAR